MRYPDEVRRFIDVQQNTGIIDRDGFDQVRVCCQHAIGADVTFQARQGVFKRAEKPTGWPRLPAYSGTTMGTASTQTLCEHAQGRGRNERHIGKRDQPGLGVRATLDATA